MNRHRNEDKKGFSETIRLDCRKTKSYSDIGSQVADDPNGHHQRWRKEKYKQMLSGNEIDYAFLRRILGVTMHLSEAEVGERFATEELREAVLKLRKQVQTLRITTKREKDWIQTLLRELWVTDTKSLDHDLLDACYMLKNAHKVGIFSSEQDLQVQ